MSRRDPDGAPSGAPTQLTVRGSGAAAERGPGTAVATADQPREPVQRAMVGMLGASVAAFGDVVTALVGDLETAGGHMTDLSWMAGSRGLLEHEGVWSSALGQLQWWDSFLRGLPYPQLLSDARVGEVRRVRAQHAGARLRARDRALADHRAAMALEVHDELSEGQSTALQVAYEEPSPGQWRVDLALYEQQELAGVPPLLDLVPILAQDVDARYNFSGFNAAQSMRTHPELAPRAVAMDAALTTLLRAELGVSRRDAPLHAVALTDMFWVALRRALDAGSHQLATSIEMLSMSQSSPIQQRFTEELLRSWLAYVQALPVVDPDAGLAGKLGKLLGGGGQKALPPTAARQLTDSATPKKGVWARVKGVFGDTD